MHKPHSALELTLLNHWQRGFPLDREPFAAIGRYVGVDATAVLAHYARLQDQGSFSRIGAVFAPGAGGASLLAAMAVLMVMVMLLSRVFATASTTWRAGNSSPAAIPRRSPSCATRRCATAGRRRSAG